MSVLRATFVLAAAGLVAAMAVSAQGPPPVSATAGLTTSRSYTDADLEALMKQVGPLNGQLRKSLDAKDPEQAEAQARQLSRLFQNVEDFFDAIKIGDAEDWADDASRYARRTESAIEARDWDKANEGAKLLGGMCQQCHSKYRDKTADGSFFFKRPK